MPCLSHNCPMEMAWGGPRREDYRHQHGGQVSAWAIANGLIRKENRMTDEHAKIQGDIIVGSCLTLHGMVTGSITVRHGGVLTLCGMCCGNLVVDKEAEAYLGGTVAGDALNRGGCLRVYGTVRGRVDTTENGKTFIDENALIGGSWT